MFFYDELSKSQGKPSSNIWDWDGTSQYLYHYRNLLYLNFIAGNPLATFAERRQAEKEILICNKKLQWWKKHPNYVHEAALEGMIQLKKKWGLKS